MEKLNTYLKNPFLFLVLLPFFYWGAGVFANFSIIDDHEIIYLIGNSGSLSFLDTFSTIMNKTEIGNWGTGTRFRPSYYLFRTFQAFLWGDSPGPWYLTRVLIMSFFLIQFFKFIDLFLKEYKYSLLVTLIIAINPFWRDILTRVGPSEIYGVFGISLCFYSLTKSFKSKTFNIKEFLTLTIGLMVFVGSKENFIFLPFVLLLLLFHPIFKKNKLFISSSLIGIASVFFICLGLYLGVKMKGSTDVYNNPVRIFDLFQRILNVFNPSLFNLFQLVIPGWIILSFNKSFKANSKYSLYLKVTIILFILYGFQFFFYGRLNFKGRYDFPGELFSIISLIMFAILVIETFFKNYKIRFFGKYFPHIVIVLTILGLKNHFKSSYRNVIASNSFQEKIQHIKDQINEKKLNEVIFTMNRIGYDFEPSISVARFLRFNKVKNKFYMNNNSPLDKAGLEKELHTKVATIESFGPNLFSNGLPKIIDFNHCVELQFSKNTKPICKFHLYIR